MADITAKDLKEWMTKSEMTFAFFSGYGKRGSLSVNGRGMWRVRVNNKVIMKTIDPMDALTAYNKIERKI